MNQEQFQNQLEKAGFTSTLRYSTSNNSLYVTVKNFDVVIIKARISNHDYASNEESKKTFNPKPNIDLLIPDTKMNFKSYLEEKGFLSLFNAIMKYSINDINFKKGYKTLTAFGFTHYAINKEGNIWDFKNKKLLVPQMNKQGHIFATLLSFDVTSSKRRLVASLVAENFIPVNDPTKIYLKFIDGNPSNISISNLEWTNVSQAPESNQSTTDSYKYSESDTTLLGINNSIKQEETKMENKRRTGNKGRKVIMDGTTVFNSLKEAADFVGSKTPNVYRSCNGGYGIKGHSFEYYDEAISNNKNIDSVPKQISTSDNSEINKIDYRKENNNIEIINTLNFSILLQDKNNYTKIEPTILPNSVNTLKANNVTLYIKKSNDRSSIVSLPEMRENVFYIVDRDTFAKLNREDILYVEVSDHIEKLNAFLISDIYRK